VARFHWGEDFAAEYAVRFQRPDLCLFLWDLQHRIIDRDCASLTVFAAKYRHRPTSKIDAPPTKLDDLTHSHPRLQSKHHYRRKP
jgi:hypothetical protein